MKEFLTTTILVSCVVLLFFLIVSFPILAMTASANDTWLRQIDYNSLAWTDLILSGQSAPLICYYNKDYLPIYLILITLSLLAGLSVAAISSERH